MNSKLQRKKNYVSTHNSTQFYTITRHIASYDWQKFVRGHAGTSIICGEKKGSSDSRFQHFPTRLYKSFMRLKNQFLYLYNFFFFHKAL